MSSVRVLVLFTLLGFSAALKKPQEQALEAKPASKKEENAAVREKWTADHAARMQAASDQAAIKAKKQEANAADREAWAAKQAAKEAKQQAWDAAHVKVPASEAEILTEAQAA